MSHAFFFLTLEKTKDQIIYEGGDLQGMETFQTFISSQTDEETEAEK